MLIVTVTTAVCLKKKYSQGRENGENLALEVSILPLSANIYIHAHIRISLYLLKSKQQNLVRSNLEDVTFLKFEDFSLGIKELQ